MADGGEVMSLAADHHWLPLDLLPRDYAVIVKRDRSARFGRRYRAEAEIVYVGGTLPDHVRKDLTAAVARALGRGASDLSLSVSSDPFNRVSVSVTLTAARPLAAITALDSVLDDTLTAAGLAEEFDLTGRELRVAPVDRVWREGGTRMTSHLSASKISDQA
jgi:hypothetical protein